MYLVSPTKNKKTYSGGKGQRLYKTLEAAKDRVKAVKKLTGKQYYISKID